MISRLSAAVVFVVAGFAALTVAAQAEQKTAIFAGGCFWCVEADFDKVPGVTETVSGYIGGNSDNPTYKNHTAAGHREAVRIQYDTDRVSYEQLLDVFFHSVDPTDGGGQFCDRGHSYTTAIYATDDSQLGAAREAKKAAAGELGREVVTPVESAPEFWPAEEYHQNYYKKNPIRYRFYRRGCGRDARLEELWGEAAMRGIEGS